MTNWITITISGFLAAFAVYKEITRPNRARLTLRVIATMVAVFALACLVLPISYNRTVDDNSDKVILLTPGTLENEYAFLHKQKVYTLDRTIAKRFPTVRLISNPAEILAENPNHPVVMIYGYGLNASDLKQLGNSKIELPAPVTKFPDGVTAVNWTQNIKVGQSFQVQGTIKNNGKPYKLVLKGLNTSLDSIAIKTNPSISFSMNSLPKNPGRVIYNLIGLRDNDTLFNEQLPVTIEAAKPIKVLMLSAAPDFENKFLRTWLGNNNYAIASRAVITKGKIGQDYFNLERIDLSHITSSLLEKFDIVEADLSAIKALPSGENSALKQEVAKGMGLIIRADTVDDKSSSWVQNSFKVSRSTKQPPEELIIQNKKTTKLAIDNQLITPNNNIQPLVTDTHGDLIAAATLSGAGKLIFSTINNSYSWDLAGDHSDYSAYWSALINKAARKARAENSWSIATQFPVPGEPAILLYHSTELSGSITINGSVVAPAQHPGIPFEWGFTYRPSHVGWQHATSNNSVAFNWFVWPKNSFAALRAAENARITTEYASKSTKYASFSHSKLQKVEVEISKFYFYILLLVAATFLWVENKYANTN